MAVSWAAAACSPGVVQSQVEVGVHLIHQKPVEPTEEERRVAGHWRHDWQPPQQ
jgi:hypothetical protein